MKNSHAARCLWALVAAVAMLSACSSSQSEEDQGDATASSIADDASPAPFPSSPTDDAAGVGPAEVGDCQLVSGRFGIYSGTQWAGFRAPRHYAIGYADEQGQRSTILYSRVDAKTNIVFHHIDGRESLFTEEELSAQLEETGISNAEIRSDVAKIGEFNAVTAFVPDSDGYKALVSAVDVGGQMWMVTINAPSESEISELFESVSKLEQLEASPREISNAPKTISGRVDGRTFEAKVARSSIKFEMPQGYGEIDEPGPATVGFEGGDEGQASVSLHIDSLGFTVDLDDAVRQIRGRSTDLTEGDVRPIDGVTEVAGYKAVAVDVQKPDGGKTRTYLLDMGGAVVELSVDVADGEEGFDELVRAVQNATT
ncbi:MAG: hypothetical protein Q3979_03395 [Actinomycetaceae bacterium]|nr:hypothetical protein [Actinomycetaceae bacterium]